MINVYRFMILCLLLITRFAISYCQDLTVEKRETLQSKLYANRPGSLGIIGDTTDVVVPTSPGTVLMGGGKDVDVAFAWMIQKSGGGNIVIIRAAGTNAYNPYVFGLGKVSSVETIKIDTRELANNKDVIRILRNAEMLFIAGGNQATYMQQWKGTGTSDAINYLINQKKVPVGGTSAGCAILGELYYSGEVGSAVSDSVLANPYHASVTLYKNDFLHISCLKNLLTDQHFITRSRQGRLVVFMSRIIKDWKIYPNAIAADERTAVCIDEQGEAKVLGTGKAYFIQSSADKVPEVCEADKPLQWNLSHKALKVYEIQGLPVGTGSFDVTNFNVTKATGGRWVNWWVENGILKTSEVNN